MFRNKQDVEMVKKLAQGELQSLLEQINSNKNAILEADTVEEIIAIKNNVAALQANIGICDGDIETAMKSVRSNEGVLSKHASDLDRLEKILEEDRIKREKSGIDVFEQ